MFTNKTTKHHYTVYKASEKIPMHKPYLSLERIEFHNSGVRFLDFSPTSNSITQYFIL